MNLKVYIFFQNKAEEMEMRRPLIILAPATQIRPNFEDEAYNSIQHVRNF